jgi:hypothetical protein
VVQAYRSAVGTTRPLALGGELGKKGLYLKQRDNKLTDGVICVHEFLQFMQGQLHFCVERRQENWLKFVSVKIPHLQISFPLILQFETTGSPLIVLWDFERGYN